MKVPTKGKFEFKNQHLFFKLAKLTTNLEIHKKVALRFAKTHNDGKISEKVAI